MSLTPEQQRYLANFYGLTNNNGFFPNAKYLADYTAAVETKRDAEVAELTRKLAEQQAHLCSTISCMTTTMQAREDEEQADLFWTRGWNSCIENICSKIELQKDTEQLTALLAKERARCASHIEEQISHSDADDEMDTCIGNTLSIAVMQIRSLK